MGLPILPRTPAEIAELHGVDPISFGFAGQLAQVWLKGTGTQATQGITSWTVGPTASVQVNPDLTNRTLWPYFYVRQINALQYALVRCRLRFQLNNSDTFVLPFENFQTGSSTNPSVAPEQWTNFSALVGSSSPGDPLTLYFSSLTAMNGESGIANIVPFHFGKISADKVTLEYIESFGADFRLYVALVSTA